MSLIILIGKSASGKSYIAENLAENFRYEKLVTCTTRPIRSNEAEGRDYFFIDEQTFQYLEDDGALVCTTNYNGWHYGIPVEQLTNGDKILIIEPIGYHELVKTLPNSVDYTSFYIDCEDRQRLIRQILRGDSIRETFLRYERDIACFQNIEKFVDFIIDGSEDIWSNMTEILEGVNLKNNNK